MSDASSDRSAFKERVASRFGLLPNFFCSARAAPELIERLWGFAEAAYLDNPAPSLFKERLFVFLSRFCSVRYCVVRHVGFLIGRGRPAGDASSAVNSVAEVLRLLRRPTPWNRDMESVYQRLVSREEPIADWPPQDTEMEDMLFACAAILFNEPARSAPAKVALIAAIGERKFEFLSGFLAFIRTAHYWTLLHPEIEVEDDMLALLSEHGDLARLLEQDSESERSEMGNRLFEELIALRELHERQELEKAKRALEEKDRQKDQFIAVLAHELRNPLAAIRAATDTLTLVGLGDQQAKRFHALVDRQTTAMTCMLEDLLDVSRVALGKVAISMEELDLCERVKGVVAEHAGHAYAAGLAIKMVLPRTPCHVRADAVRLDQVIGNLLSNAIKFTRPSGRIWFELNATDNEVVLRVTDTGVGFDREVTGRLFEPFFQAGAEATRGDRGLGLGLAISARLTELQGGRLSAASDGPGKGAVFSLALPRAYPRGASVGTEITSCTGSGRVLVVEDNDDVAKCVAELIETLGFDVEIAKDGREAVARAKAMIPKVILCDLDLAEGMDGCAVARACKSEPLLGAVRLIAASGYSRAREYENAKAAGFEQLLAKPITRKSLQALLLLG